MAEEFLSGEDGAHDPELLRILGRLQAHQLLIESMFSLAFAQQPDGSAATWASELVRISKNHETPTADPAELAAEFAINATSEAVVARVMERAVAKARVIRANISEREEEDDD